jgi:hypothetical protein
MLGYGFTPHAMLWRPEMPAQMKYVPEESWLTFARCWARPVIVHAREVVPYGKGLARRSFDPAHDALHAIERGAVQGLLAIANKQIEGAAVCGFRRAQFQ